MKIKLYKGKKKAPDKVAENMFGFNTDVETMRLYGIEKVVIELEEVDKGILRPYFINNLQDL